MAVFLKIIRINLTKHENILEQMIIFLFVNVCFYIDGDEHQRNASQLSVLNWCSSCYSLEAGSVCSTKL